MKCVWLTSFPIIFIVFYKTGCKGGSGPGSYQTDRWEDRNMQQNAVLSCSKWGAAVVCSACSNTYQHHTLTAVSTDNNYKRFRTVAGTREAWIGTRKCLKRETRILRGET